MSRKRAKNRRPGRKHGADRVTRAPNNSPPPDRSTLGEALDALRSYRHRAAALTHLASVAQTTFTKTELGPPRLRIVSADGTTELADAETIRELVLELRHMAERSQAQARELLRTAVCGLGSETSARLRERPLGEPDAMISATLDRNPAHREGLLQTQRRGETR